MTRPIKSTPLVPITSPSVEPMVRINDAVPKLCVLVAADDPGAAEMTADMLRGHGFRVVAAVGGAEALRAAAAESPDVVLADLTVDETDAFELARRLREGAGGKPAVLVSVTTRRSADAGFDLHLTKPVEPAVLVGLLRRFGRALLPG